MADVTIDGSIDLSDDYWYPQVFIDQLTDDIYVVYNGKRDGSQTLGTATTVNYVKSTVTEFYHTQGGKRVMRGRYVKA